MSADALTVDEDLRYGVGTGPLDHLEFFFSVRGDVDIRIGHPFCVEERLCLGEDFE